MGLKEKKAKPWKDKRNPIQKCLVAVKKNWQLYLMALPAVVLLFCFAYMPMGGLVIAFKKYNFKKGIWGSDWMDPWYKNFEILFHNNAAALNAIRNTIFLNFLFIVCGTIFALALALAFNEVTNKYIKKLTQSFSFLPYFISTVVVGIFVTGLLGYENGVINRIITSFGGEKIAFYMEAKWWPMILVIVNIWKGAGYSAVVYLATISGFDNAYYEAAKIDGATRWQQTWYISLPLLRPTVITLTLLSVGKIMNADFGLFYNVTGDMPTLYATADVLDGLKVETAIENTAKDHRVRVIFPTGLKAVDHFADSNFEVVKRLNRHGKNWKNPSGCEHQQNFVAMCDEGGGMLVANFGLYEYEILPDQDNAIAVTLLRCVGEMGDWGVFPTWDSQMQGTYRMSYEAVPFAPGEIMEAYKEGYQFQSDLTVCQVPVASCGEIPPCEKTPCGGILSSGQASFPAKAKEESLKTGADGSLSGSGSFLEWEGQGLNLTGFKRQDEGGDVIVRFVNVSEGVVTLKIKKAGWMKGLYHSNVLEEAGEEIGESPEGYYVAEVRPFEIATFGAAISGAGR